MRLPRNLSGKELVQRLGRFGYHLERQTGSHARLSTFQGGEHHLTVPMHSELRVGTLASILSDVSSHLKMTRSELLKQMGF